MQTTDGRVASHVQACAQLAQSPDAPLPPWTSRRGRGSRRVGFDDPGGDNNAAGGGTKPDEAEKVLEGLGIALTELRAADIMDYFEIKSLIEFLPANCLLPVNSTDASPGASPAQSPRRALRRMSVGGPAERHHWATTHGWQLFLREVPRAPLPPKSGAETERVRFLDTTSLRLMRQRLLDSVVDATGHAAQTISALHLQVHAFWRDKALLPFSTEHDEQQRLRAQFQAFHHTMGGDGTGDEDSETRSVVSSHSHTSRSTTRSRSRTRGRAKHSLTASRTDDLWISLKGLVFRINLNTESSGRNIYYKTILGPIYSGKDCTLHFAINTLGKDADFVGATRSDFGIDSLDAVRDADGNFSRDVQDHLNQIFCVFLHDFTLIGALEGGENLWF